ncbi:response regulator [Penaeicola halotolerans]|uniref:response regulator n=1 Tax=Penaeicola halotolerans TaxID=2793196 RepID=UPI001CF902D9|nr:response regulator [Penaeicola halotolerans]
MRSKRSFKYIPHRIALIYLIFGACWILGSDRLLTLLDELFIDYNVAYLQTIKGLVFVFITAALIYFFVKSFNRKLIESEAHYRLVFQDNPNPMWIYDQDTLAFIEVNAMAVNSYGYSTRDFYSMKVDDLLHQEMGKASTVHKVVYNSMVEERHLKKDGSVVLMQVYAHPFIFEGRSAVLALLIDVTEKEMSLQENQKLNSFLKEQNEQLRKYSYINSHKVRAPLTNILGLVNLLNEEKTLVEESLISKLKTAADQLDNEIQVINKILSSRTAAKHIGEMTTGKQINHVMLVDDDSIQHLINTKMIKSLHPNMKVSSYTEGELALSYLLDGGQDMPDLLLLDINMPSMNGWQFLDKLQAKEIQMEVKMVTSSIDPNDVLRSMKYNQVNGFIIKPLSKENLSEIL